MEISVAVIGGDEIADGIGNVVRDREWVYFKIAYAEGLIILKHNPILSVHIVIFRNCLGGHHVGEEFGTREFFMEGFYSLGVVAVVMGEDNANNGGQIDTAILAAF